jgi:hypothetical protein
MLSPLHQEDMRATASASFPHVKELNARRSALLLPAQSLDPTETDAKVPVLLIQQPGHRLTTSNCSLFLLRPYVARLQWTCPWLGRSHAQQMGHGLLGTSGIRRSSYTWTDGNEALGTGSWLVFLP